MHRHHNRTLQINKADLIAKIEENKVKHVKEFAEAKEAYKVEALTQLENLKKKVEGGDLHISLKLVSPVDRVSEYDKVIEMFKWDVNDIIELSQDEFNEYVHDENDGAKQAKMSNSYYASFSN